MRRLDLTLESPAENLALDEALLDWAEALMGQDAADSPPGDAERCAEVLRLWEPIRPFVVLGRGSHVEREVDLAACHRLGIPVLRRASGGAAVVVGPGCLLYAVVLSYDLRPDLRPLDSAHRFVLGRVAEAVSSSVTRSSAARVVQAGTSDLVVAQDTPSGKPAASARGGTHLGERKCSGNSLRCKRTHFLYHGTLMYDFDIDLIENCLRMPPRQPQYRQRRSHADFLVNLPVTAPELRRGLARIWQAAEPLIDWPREETARLAESRYNCESWTWSR